MYNINLFVLLFVFIYGLSLFLILYVVGHISSKLGFLITKKYKKISEANATLIAFIIVFMPIFICYIIVSSLPFVLNLFDYKFKDLKDYLIFILTFLLGMSTSANMVKLKNKIKGN